MVSQGFMHTYGIDYDETFIKIIPSSAVNVAFAIIDKLGSKARPLDAKTAFSYAKPEKSGYMHQSLDIMMESSVHSVKQLFHGFRGFY